jgi:hypothetical protein
LLGEWFSWRNQERNDTMPMIQLPDYDNNPTHVDMSIPACKRATLQILSVEPQDNSEKGISDCVNFGLKVLSHDDEQYNGREFRATFWYPNPSKDTALQVQATVARWKQLCKATGIEPDSSGELDPHSFQGEKFDGEIISRKSKTDSSKHYADLGEVYFS